MSNTSSPFGQNEWLVEEMYRKFRDDPSSVDPSWHEFLVDYNPEASPADGQPAAPQTKAAQTAAPAVTAPDWSHAYSRQQAAYPVPWLWEHKYWPSVGRIDNVFGDRNLVCRCPMA